MVLANYAIVTLVYTTC